MGSCDNWTFGKESDMEKLADICVGVRTLLATKYDSKGNIDFRDWTGIGEFIIFYDDLKQTLQGQKIGGFSAEEIEEEWIDCQPKKGEVAIFWMEIEWAHKIPSEVWAFMVQESKRLKIERIVRDLIHEWGLENEEIFDLVEGKLGAI